MLLRPDFFKKFSIWHLIVLDGLSFLSQTSILVVFWKLCYMYWLPAMQLEAWSKAEKALDSSIQEDLLKNSFTIKQNNFVKWDYLITGIIIFTIAQKTVLLNWVMWPRSNSTQ